MYRANYRCVVDGQQEKMYFDRISRLLTRRNELVITINSSIGNLGDFQRDYSDYPKARVFDYDFKKTQFQDNLEYCSKMSKNHSAKRLSSVYHAYSNVCFDLWLVLHKADYNRTVGTTYAYADALREAYGLSPNDDIKNSRVLKEIMQQIDLNDVLNAIRRASKIRRDKIESDAHHINDVTYYDNPDFSIDRFIYNIISDIPQSLLMAECKLVLEQERIC